MKAEIQKIPSDTTEPPSHRLYTCTEVTQSLRQEVRRSARRSEHGILGKVSRLYNHTYRHKAFALQHIDMSNCNEVSLDSFDHAAEYEPVIIVVFKSIYEYITTSFRTPFPYHLYQGFAPSHLPTLPTNPHLPEPSPFSLSCLLFHRQPLLRDPLSSLAHQLRTRSPCLGEHFHSPTKTRTKRMERAR